MRLLNPELFSQIILPGLLSSTIWSALIAVLVGTVVGTIVGMLRGKVRRTTLPAIAGSFFGTMLFCLLPIHAFPGIVGGGGYGGIWILAIAVVTLPVGAVGGAIAGSLLGEEIYIKQQQKGLLWMLLGTYLIMAGVMFTTITVHCSRRNTLPDYCARAGYPQS